MKLKEVVSLEPEADKTHPLYKPMENYGWLLIRLIPLFGTDRIVMADRKESLAICVYNGKQGNDFKSHSMWLTKGSYDLNALPEEKRDTLVRHFIKDTKLALWGEYA